MNVIGRGRRLGGYSKSVTRALDSWIIFYSETARFSVSREALLHIRVMQKCFEVP